MITWHARVYNLRKYRPTTAYCIKLGKSGTRRSPGVGQAGVGQEPGRTVLSRLMPPPQGEVALGQVVRYPGTCRGPAGQFSGSRPEAHAGR